MYTYFVPLSAGALLSALIVFFLTFFFFTQSLEWNDEPIEEAAGTVSALSAINDASEQSLENKVDNLVVINEENEWDKLLRVR